MRTETTRATSATFAANRAQGRVKFDVHLQDGVTRRGVLHESGSLRVRFPSPVPVNSRLRAHFKLMSFEPIEGGVQLITEVTVEREGQAKPVCVAESVGRLYS